jgi:hypothetical protein
MAMLAPPVSIRAFLRRHWASWLGISFQVPSAAKWALGALDWRSRYDAFGEYLQDAGGWRAMFAILLNPPSWFYPTAFVIGVALIWWDASRSMKRHRQKTAQTALPAVKGDARDNAQPPPPQLPPNAKFSFKGRVFYHIAHNYSHEENIEFRSALRDAYDCLAHDAEPITATYNGPVVQFTSNLVSTILSQRATGAYSIIDGIEKQATNANLQLMSVLEKRPYFRSDLQSIIWPPPLGPDDLRGAIHKYQAALKSIPDNPTRDLINLALGHSEKLLEAAAAAHLQWIGQVYRKINGAREELEALASLE